MTELEKQWAFVRWTKDNPRHSMALYSTEETRDKFVGIFMSRGGRFSDYEMQLLWKIANKLEGQDESK